jgi:hypothetical protein
MDSIDAMLDVLSQYSSYSSLPHLLYFSCSSYPQRQRYSHHLISRRRLTLGRLTLGTITEFKADGASLTLPALLS